MTLLNKHNFKALQKKTSIVECKDYDTEIKIEALSLQDQLEIDDLIKTDMNSYIKEMVARCVIDEDGVRVFSVDDVESLPADLTVLVFQACCKLNKLGTHDVTDAAKN